MRTSLVCAILVVLAVPVTCLSVLMTCRSPWLPVRCLGSPAEMGSYAASKEYRMPRHR